MPERSDSQPLIRLSSGLYIPAPLALAEDLTHDEAWALNKDPSRQSHAARLYQSGWANLEAAHCLPRVDRRLDALGRAAVIFQQVEGGDSSYVHAAGRVIDFIPIYAYRVQGDAYPASDVRVLYGRLGRRVLACAETETDKARGDFYEDVFLAICASIDDPDYFAFPASVREEASSSRKENYNQDASIIRGRKIAIQLKGGHGSYMRYQSQVRKIRVRRSIIAAAVHAYGAGRWNATFSTSNKRYQMPPDQTTELCKLTGHLLLAEANGSRELSEQDVWYLGLLRASMMRHIDAEQGTAGPGVDTT